MGNEIQASMSPAQYQAFSDRMAKQLAASTFAAQQAVMAKALDKGLDKGADAAGSGDPSFEKGLRTKVNGESSSITPLTLLIGTTTGGAPSNLAANIFSWYDLYPPIGTTGNITVAGTAGFTNTSVVLTIATPAQFAAAGLGQQAPNSVGAAAGTLSWLSLAGSASQGLTPLQQYQLAVVYLAQNIAQCESLNVQSSEAAPAAVINSGQATEYYNSPFIAAQNNTVVFTNATEPTDFKTNQILVLLEMTMSLLHFIQLTTSVQNLSAAVITVNCQVNVRYGERRGAQFKDKISNMPDKKVATRSAGRSLAR
jgi:hypothetical protein